jgi:Flp pilus assembly protein TadG
MMVGPVFKKLYQWWHDDLGAVVAEAALMFPVLTTLLLGTFDVGNALVASQKTINASQIAADLLSRKSEVSPSDVHEAFIAARSAMLPLRNDTLNVYVASIIFDENSNPQILWSQKTEDADIDDNILDQVQNLGGPGEGLLAVTTYYTYHPTFSGKVIGDVQMQEVSFVRGRRTSVVTLTGS